MVYHEYNNGHYLLLILWESLMVRTIYLRSTMKYHLLAVIRCLVLVEEFQVAWPFKANLCYSHWWSKKVFYAPVSALWEHLILRGQGGMLLFKLRGNWREGDHIPWSSTSAPVFPSWWETSDSYLGLGFNGWPPFLVALKTVFDEETGWFWRRRKIRFSEGKPLVSWLHTEATQCVLCE